MIEINPEICPACGEEELRPVRIGNNSKGWQLTGDFECDNCDETFRHANNTDVPEPVEPLEVYPEDDYQNYKDEEINNLNNK